MRCPRLAMVTYQALSFPHKDIHFPLLYHYLWHHQHCHNTHETYPILRRREGSGGGVCIPTMEYMQLKLMVTCHVLNPYHACYWM